MRRLPSLRGLQAFEAVARAGSLANAAELLGITPSAVSHRLRSLEEELGKQLLQRSASGLSLTEAGRRYRVGVGDAFAKLAEATSALVGPDLSRPLTVSLSTSIGVRWLMPRFDRFRTCHPDIEIAILSTNRLADLAAGDAHLALRYGKGAWPNLCADLILECTVTPLCAPSVAERLAGRPPTEALAEATMLECTDDDWDIWLDAAEAAGVEPVKRLNFPDCSMAAAAAVHGQGVMMGYSSFADEELAAGTLVQPFALTVPAKSAYYLVYQKEQLDDARVRAFRDWILSESASGPQNA